MNDPGGRIHFLSLPPLYWLGLIGAAATMWALSAGLFGPALILLAGVLFVSLQFRRVLMEQKLFTSRLCEAATQIGDSAFTRPVSPRAGSALDPVAAAMAARSDDIAHTLQRLRQFQKSLEALFNAFQGPALILDAGGVVQKVNPAVTDRFQIQPEDAIGRPLLQVVREHQIDDAISTVLERGQGTSCEVDVFTARRPARYVVRIEPVADDDQGRLAGAVVLLFDVTRLHHLERVRREFVANVSHELRTPITSIKGFIETLLEDDVPSETRHRFLGILKQEADRLDALLGDLLDLSLLESNTSPLRRESIRMSDLATSVLTSLEPQARKKRITTAVHIPPDLPLVPANPEMLEQVFINLVDNAIKYSPEGGWIRIEARRVAGEHVEFAVADSGPGIPSEYLPRLFERFYRVDKARSRSVGGTGLGLAIVRHIVQRHGGSVRAESRLGKGSRFIVTLPLHAEEAPVPTWDQ